MLPGRGYSIIYRAITGNCTLQQFVDSYCTVLNKENIDSGTQDILKRRKKKKKKVLQSRSISNYVFLQGSSSPCVITILVIYSAKYVASENRLLPEYQLISEFEVCPVFSLKDHFRELRLPPCLHLTLISFLGC